MKVNLRRYKMGIFDRLFRKKKRRVEEYAAQKDKQPKIVREEQKWYATYEIYKGTDPESAKSFLLTKNVDKESYYIVVETPEGNWGVVSHSE